MDEARGLQYGVDFETGEAGSSIDQLIDQVDELEQQLGASEMGARRMGAGLVSGCNGGVSGADRLSGAINNAGDSMDDLTDRTRTAEDTTRRFGGGLDEAGGDADDLRSRLRETAEGAGSLSEAFRETMADGLEAGQSIAESFRTGLTGAVDFSRNKVKTFVSDTVKGAKNIADKFKHPIQTLRTGLVDALRRAQDSEEDVGDGARDAGDDLQDMGAEGEDAGNQIADAIKGVVAAFMGFEAIKQGIELLKQFGAAALSAYSATETTAKQFDVLFSTSASEWVENYSDAVHRSTAEIRGFMVENQTMYKNLGIIAEEAEQLSQVTTSLAYDFGNFFSMADDEALGLLQSAIEGDTSALTAYGIALDDVALQQSAAALGLGDNIEALDDAAMAQVRLNAILEQSGAIQEAAVNQTGGLTNSMKSLNGVLGNFLSTAGSKFAPTLERVIGAVVDEWPTLELMLLSFVDVLADGLSSVAPTLIELGKNLVPTLTSVLGTLVGAAGPVLAVFSSIAGSALPPLVAIIDSLVSSALPPFLSVLETLNANVIQPLIPVIQQIAVQVLPVFGQAFSAAGQIIGQLASSVIPPLTQILGVLVQAISPLVSAAQNFISVLLPPLSALISAFGSMLSSVVLPAVSALSPALSVVADVLSVITDGLGKVVGWVSEGAGKVADFFGGLFGGAKESKTEVEALGNSVADLSAATESVKAPELTIPQPEVPEVPPITVPVETGQFELPEAGAEVEPFVIPVTAETPDIELPAVEAVHIPVSVDAPVIPEPVVPQPEVEPVKLPVEVEKPVIPEPDIVPVTLPVTVEQPVIPEPEIVMIVIPTRVQKPVIPDPELPELPTLVLETANTLPFRASIAQAAADAARTGEASAKAVQSAYTSALEKVGTAADSTFAQAASEAERSWSRMVEAAQEGARKIAASFADIGTAASQVNNARLTISSANIPGHAEGTPSFEGGWTRMNEEGGELAFLPQGTAILPADKTDEIINSSNNSSSSTVEYTDSSTFAPQFSITIGGGAEVDEDALMDRMKAELERFWREKKEEEYHIRALQGAYTISG